MDILSVLVFVKPAPLQSNLVVFDKPKERFHEVLGKVFDKPSFSGRFLSNQAFVTRFLTNQAGLKVSF